MLPVWAVVACLLSAEASDAPRKDEGFDALAVPLISYNSDLGFGLGAVGGAYFYSKGYRPFRHSISAQVFFTTNGVQSHFLRYDGPQLLGTMRVEARLELRRELLSPWYGFGNQALSGLSPNPDERQWNYRKRSPMGWLRGRIRPLGLSHPFELYAGYRLAHTRVELFENSLLAQDMPEGIEGGYTGQVQVGALWDTRDLEGDPSHGGVEELSFRTSSRLTVSDYTFWGLSFSSRRFFPLQAEKLILAQRVVFDAMFGEVPFFELPHTGGIYPAEGIGGMSSLRGVMRNRYVGNTKAMLTTELRYYPWAFSLFKVRTKLGGLAFVDFARAWHAGVDDGPFWNWHPTSGIGLRLARRQAVIRADLGYAFETARLGVYVTFGHMF